MEEEEFDQDGVFYVQFPSRLNSLLMKTGSLWPAIKAYLLKRYPDLGWLCDKISAGGRIETDQEVDMILDAFIAREPKVLESLRSKILFKNSCLPFVFQFDVQELTDHLDFFLYVDDKLREMSKE